MYREVAPSLALAPYVECFWTRRDERDGAAAPTEHRILPDGCIDLIFAFHPGPSGGLAEAYAVGTMTRAIVVPGDARVAMLGVRFHPGGASALLGLQASALTDLRVALRDAAPCLPDDTEEGLHAVDASGRVAALARALERLLPRAAAVDPLVDAASRWLRRTDGRLRVESLGDRLGVSRQHLARAFARHVGVTPKTFARVARVLAVVRRASGDPDPDWTRIALEHGYADQSHLTGEFRTLVGLTPGRWAAGA